MSRRVKSKNRSLLGQFGFVALLIPLLFLFVFQVWLNLRIQGWRNTWDREDRKTDPLLESCRPLYADPTLYKVLSFGYLPMSMDWLWLRSLIVIHEKPSGKIILENGSVWHPPLFYNLDLLSDLDPAFYETYYAGANLLTVVYDDHAGALHLLRKGNKFASEQLPLYSKEFRSIYWHNYWVLSMTMAYVYLFELHDMPKAALAFIATARQENAPQYLLNLAERLKKPGGQYEVGLRLLGFMISGAKDQKVRDGLENKRKSLYLTHYLAEINQKFRTFLAGQASYREAEVVLPSQLKEFWEHFLRETNMPGRDPFGGEMTIDDTGRVVSSTPREQVLNLD